MFYTLNGKILGTKGIKGEEEMKNNFALACQHIDMHLFKRETDPRHPNETGNKEKEELEMERGKAHFKAGNFSFALKYF